MCGIAGYLNLNAKPASEIICKRMTDKIRHRGPDGEGQFVDGPVALGHRRLAIIDLSPAGSQPMVSSSKNLVITFNGEVYNFKEIRAELQSLGHHFHSKTDTEVILTSYQQWGEKCVSRFNGMFAFVIWDRVKKELFIARDRFGIKPLYYAIQGETFLFASENKAFEEFPGFQRKIDRKGLFEYMSFQNFLGEGTLFEDVKMFPAGSVAILRLGDRSLKTELYWDFHFEEPKGKLLTENEYIEELDFLVRQAVNRQLISDVEIGAYLSGGMDSGSITALAAQQLPYIKTFTVGFDLNSASGLELAFDERAKAEHMSYLFKTEHYEMVLKSGDMERCLPQLAYHLEEPRVGQSYPNYYAAKLASKFTKVTLSGCGGDEIFGGYPWRYFRSLGCTDFDGYLDEYFQYWQRLLTTEDSRQVFAPIWNDVKDVSLKGIFKDVYKNHKNRLETKEDFINHSLYFESKTFLAGLLIVEDKLSMAHSLETRVPFLDNDLVDFSMKIPVSMKISDLSSNMRIDENAIDKSKQFHRNNSGKAILRKTMEKYIPQSVTEREKQGFSAPDASWFRGESIEYVRNLLTNKNARIYEFFDYNSVNVILNKHLSGQENKRLFIWSLLNLENQLKAMK